jgi:chromosomal replication initiator protein
MPDAIWQGAHAWLRRELAAKDYETWIVPLRPARWVAGELTLEAPSAFHRDWLRRHFLDRVEAAVAQASGGAATVRLDVNRALDLRPTAPEGRPPAEPATPDATGHQTFEDFVVGESNRVAYEAARAVVEQPGQRFSPLFVYGGVGLGKTHLLSAIARAIAAVPRAGTVVSVTAEDFVNEMVRALRGGAERMDRFRRRFRNVGTLVLDDIQFLAGKRRSQEEFCHTFKALHAGRKQIVIASDNPPHDMPDIEENLRSRFSSGLLADIRPPDAALRLALVERKARQRRLVLEPDLVGYLAERWCGNVRVLEGVLTRLDAMVTLSGTQPTLRLAQEVLGGGAGASAATVERIIDEVCRQYTLTRAEIASPRRTARVALPRQVAMYLCRHHTDAPLARIGAELGGRDHSTVAHALGAIERKLQRDARLREVVSAVRGRLGA